MASSDFLDDIPSSPLSSVPSDFDRSSEQREVHESSSSTKSSSTSKRKAPTTRSAPPRASRRLKTEDSFECSLTAIKEDIILPKVAKSRQSARKATKRDVERASSPVELQKTGSDDQLDGTGDADTQLAKPDVADNGPASVASPQPRQEEVPLVDALEAGAINGDDVTGQASSTSIQDAPGELLQAQQPLSPPVDEAPKRLGDAQKPLPTPATGEPPQQPAHAQNAPSLSPDEAPEYPPHAQKPEAAPEEDHTVDVKGEIDLRPLRSTETSNTPSSPMNNIPRTVAHKIPDETTEAKKADKLSAAGRPDETPDELTQDEPRTNNRPSRKRLQPTKLEDCEPPVKAVSTVKKKPQPLRGNWSVSHLLTNPKSKLATCNLNALLNHENAWTLLSREQQLKLIAMLPPFIQENFPEFPDDMPIPNIMRQVMQSNNSFQADIRLFQEDLAAGRYEPKWLEDAQEAMEERAQGHFDDWKERNREEFWGQKQKVDWTTNSGESAQYTLVDLVKAGLFEVGDIWCLKCGGQGVKVEKEAKICAIAADGALSFTYPPGEHKYSSPANSEDILLESVRNPKALTDAMLNEDGRLAGVRRGNAWRDYRCIRKAQDIGSPWDMRELYNVRQSSS